MQGYLYRKNDYGSFKEAQEDDAVYTFEIVDDNELNTFFRDTLCSISNVLDTANTCYGIDSKLEFLVKHPFTNEILPWYKYLDME